MMATERTRGEATEAAEERGALGQLRGSVRPARPRRGAFAVLTVLFLLLIVGTNLPTPLYPVYEREYVFTPVVLTLVFATYALVLIPSLVLAGPLAGAIGYRTVLLGSLLLGVLGAVLFALADGVTWLFAARAVQGLAVGAASGAFTAALLEVERGRNVRRASLAATAATVGGGGLGPILAGVFADTLPDPLALVFWLEAGVLLAGTAVLLVLMPHRMGSGGERWRPRLPAVPAALRRSFAPAATASFLAWVVAALFISLVPSYVAAFAGRSTIVFGVASGLMFVCSALAQMLLSRMPTRAAQRWGLLLLALGLAGLVIGGNTGLLVLVLAAAVTAGTGHGLAFMGSLRQCNAASEDPGVRAGLLTAFYVASYVGVGVPIIGAGLLATLTGTTPAVDLFSLATIAACLVVTVWVNRRAPRD